MTDIFEGKIPTFKEVVELYESVKNKYSQYGRLMEDEVSATSVGISCRDAFSDKTLTAIRAIFYNKSNLIPTAKIPTFGFFTFSDVFSDPKNVNKFFSNGPVHLLADKWREEDVTYIFKQLISSVNCNRSVKPDLISGVKLKNVKVTTDNSNDDRPTLNFSYEGGVGIANGWTSSKKDGSNELMPEDTDGKRWHNMKDLLKNSSENAFKEIPFLKIDGNWKQAESWLSIPVQVLCQIPDRTVSIKRTTGEGEDKEEKELDAMGFKYQRTTMGVYLTMIDGNEDFQYDKWKFPIVGKKMFNTLGTNIENVAEGQLLTIKSLTQKPYTEGMGSDQEAMLKTKTLTAAGNVLYSGLANQNLHKETPTTLTPEKITKILSGIPSIEVVKASKTLSELTIPTMEENTLKNSDLGNFAFSYDPNWKPSQNANDLKNIASANKTRIEAGAKNQSTPPSVAATTPEK